MRTSPMPFDPKLINPDQPPLSADGDLDLPADLKALAEQLCEDASHLASCYPSPQLAQPALAVARRKRQAAAISAAGLLLALVLGGVGIWLGPASSKAHRASHEAIMDRTTSPSAIKKLQPLP